MLRKNNRREEQDEETEEKYLYLSEEERERKLRKDKLREFIELAYWCYANKVPIPTKDIEEFKGDEKIEYYVEKPMIFKVNVLNRTRELVFKPYMIKLKCNCRAGVEDTFYPLLENVVLTRCPFCKSPLEVVDVLTMPVTSGYCSIEYEKKSWIMKYVAIGLGAEKITVGQQKVVGYIKLNLEKKKRAGKVDTYIVPLLIIFDVVQDVQKVSINDVLQKVMPILQRDRYEYITAIVDSIAPHIIGQEDVKLLLLLTVIGAGFCRDEHVMRQIYRFWCHALLIGSSATGKSQIVTAIRNIAPKSILISGRTVTEASLTMAYDVATGTYNLGILALMDGNEVDHGVVIVEQIDTWKQDLLHVIRDVLERGEIGVAKKGIPEHVSARCTFIVTSNWVFEEYKPNMTFQDNLPSALKSSIELSRFDAIIITDTPKTIEEYIRISKQRWLSEEFKTHYLSEVELREFIKYVRSVEIKEFTREAKEKVVEVSSELVKILQRLGMSLSIGFRFENAIARLSIAYAKLQLKDRVDVDDVKTVYELIKLQYAKIGQVDEAISKLLIGVHPSERSLIELLYNLISQECKEVPCDKQYVFKKFRELIESFNMSEDELRKVLKGKSLTQFFDYALSKLYNMNLVYFPKHGMVKTL